MIETIPGGIPKVGLLRRGQYNFKITEIDRENETGDGRLMPKLTLVATEPQEAVGETHYEQFCIGTQDDPQADEEETWKRTFGARQLTTLSIDGADISNAGKAPAQWFDELEGQIIGVTMKMFTEPEKIKSGPNAGEDNPYAGQQKNKIAAYWKPGTRETFVVDDDTEVRPTARAAAAKVAAKPPVAAPPKAAPPRTPPVKASAAPPAKANGADQNPPKQVLLKCTLCPAGSPGAVQGIARADYNRHLTEDHPEDNE